MCRHSLRGNREISNENQQSTHRTQGRERASQALERVRQAARRGRRRSSLRSSTHQHRDCLRMAFFALKRDAASGVDGLTWPTYEADLDRNLTDLHERVSSGSIPGTAVNGPYTFPSRTGGSARSRSPHTHRTALLANQPLGSAEVTHPFHPLRGQRFVVLKIRRVSGVETLSLRHVELGSFAVPREWTDWAPLDASKTQGRFLKRTSWWTWTPQRFAGSVYA
jgi:hypothetical protein